MIQDTDEASKRRRAYKQEYYKKNKDNILSKNRIYAREYYKENKVEILAKQREYRQANRETFNSKRREWRWNQRGAMLPDRPEPSGCEICGCSNKSGRPLCLDHCHETGAFRGWLCINCNSAIGKLGDSVSGIEKVLKYLRRAYS